ncbi:N-formyl-4-amino-5-aminomethyl-2-methylpyrimidine deformylase [subsurface metagenome]
MRVKGEPRAPGARWKGPKQVGVSAIEKLPEVIKALVELESKFNKSTVPSLYKGKPPISLVMGKISGGFYETITAGECSIRGSLYFVSSIGSVKQAMEEIQNAISKAIEKDPWLKQHPPEVFFLHHRNKSEIDPREPIIAAVKNAGGKALGFKPIVTGGLMPADQSFYINQAKVPAVVFGPGSIAQAHQIDDYIEIGDLINGAKSLALTIYEWCK